MITRDGVEMDLGLRPRWGTMSVRSHMDANGVAMDLLLYDRLVFPVPVDEDQADDWDREGWDTTVLATRLVQLTPERAHIVLWDEEMRLGWKYLMDQRDDPNDPDAPFDLTARWVAEQAFERIASTDELASLDGVPLRFPASEYTGGVIGELISGHRDPKQAQRLWGLPSEDGGPAVSYDESPKDGLLVRLQLACPVDPNQERSLHQVLELVEDDDFSTARRNLWAWEQQLEEGDYTEAEAEVALTQLVEDYNTRVEAALTNTVRRRVLYAAPIAAGVALDLSTSGVVGTGLGVASTVGFDLIKAHFPQLDEEHEHVSHHPGSAIRGALSVLAHQAGPREGARTTQR